MCKNLKYLLLFICSFQSFAITLDKQPFVPKFVTQFNSHTFNELYLNMRNYEFNQDPNTFNKLIEIVNKLDKIEFCNEPLLLLFAEEFTYLNPTLAADIRHSVHDKITENCPTNALLAVFNADEADKVALTYKYLDAIIGGNANLYEEFLKERFWAPKFQSLAKKHYGFHGLKTGKQIWLLDTINNNKGLINERKKRELSVALIVLAKQYLAQNQIVLFRMVMWRVFGDLQDAGIINDLFIRQGIEIYPI